MEPALFDSRGEYSFKPAVRRPVPAVLLVSYLDRLLVSAQCSASPGGEPGESAPSPAGTEPQALLRARELKLV